MTDVGDLEQARTTSGRTNEKEKRPPLGSFITCLMYSVLTVTSFTIVIPTSFSYITSLGGNSTLAGTLIGLVPIASALCQPFISPILKRYDLRSILIVLCFLNIFGSVLYSLAKTTNWVGTALIARVISGCAGGSTYNVTYISRTTDHSTRSLYMQYFGVAVSIGYGIGPLLASVLTRICSSAGLAGNVLNTNTIPGWFMAILFGIEAILITFFMIEPPRDIDEQRPPQTHSQVNHNTTSREEESKALPIPWGRVLLALVVVFLTPLNIASLEVHTTAIAEKHWGWSSENSGIYLGCINLLVVPFSLIPIARYVQDNKGMLWATILLLVINPMFWDYHLDTVFASAMVLGTGAFLLLTSAQFHKSFAWGHVSKLPPAARRPDVIVINTFVYMMGRGLGSIVAPYIDTEYGVFLLCINGGMLLFIFIAYKQLTLLEEKSK